MASTMGAAWAYLPLLDHLTYRMDRCELLHGTMHAYVVNSSEQQSRTQS